MDPNSHATDPDDWEPIVLPPDPPPRRSSLNANHVSTKLALRDSKKYISFFDIMYDDTRPKHTDHTNVLNSSQTRDTAHEVAFKSRKATASGTPIEPSTETDANSSVSQTRSEETRGRRPPKYENPLKTIDASLERPTPPDAAHHHEFESLKSRALHAVEPSASPVPLPSQNTKPLRPESDHVDIDQAYMDMITDQLLSQPPETLARLRKWRVRMGQRYSYSLSTRVESLEHRVHHVAEAQRSSRFAASKLRLGQCDSLSVSSKNKLLRIIDKFESATTTLDKYITTNTDLTKRLSDHVIPGFLDFQHAVDATGDTGAKYNFLNEAFAKRCNFKIDSASTRRITIASGKKVMTTGIAEVTFCFRGEQTSYPLRFHILPGCIKDVILGKSFLKATKTFSNALNFGKRVVKRFTKTLNTYQVMFLGATHPMFAGLLNGETKTALADSASKVLIMDEDYAQTLGLSIVSTKKTCIKLRFADGSTAFTSGKTYDVSWQFGTGKRYYLDFYILKNAPADVILSEDFLLRETEAFSKYANCLMEEEGEGIGDCDDSDDDDHFFAIYCDENYHPQAYTGADQYFEDDRESSRREEEDSHIAKLEGAEKDAAIEKAEARREQWNAAQAANILAQAAQHDTTNAATPSVPAQSQPSNTAGKLSTSKLQRWKSKFTKKRKPGQTGQNP